MKKERRNLEAQTSTKPADEGANLKGARAKFIFGVILILAGPIAWGQETAPDAVAPTTQDDGDTPPREYFAPNAPPVAPVAPATPVLSPSPDMATGIKALRLGELDAAIAKQNQRRSSARAGFVIGGVMILGGIIATAVQTANEEEERAEQTGQYSDDVKINWSGFGIGVLIAVPIITGSVWTLRDANRQGAELFRQRRAVTLTSEQGNVRLNIAFSF